MSDEESRAARISRRLRMLPLYATFRVARVLAAVVPGSRQWHPTRPGLWQRGISVLIPERGTPDLLAESLAAAIDATRVLTEPSQIVVLVNGEPRTSYTSLISRWPEVEWQFFAEPLGFNGAIEAGLQSVRHDWVYLLNSDMRLAPDAIERLLPYRSATVFGLTSQIFFTDPTRRREETGWSDFRVAGFNLEMFEREPELEGLARGNLYPGGGSSLLRTDVLRRFIRGSRGYAPFYYEDAEWGVRAWSEGMECWFVPSSHAWHHHRGTVRRYWSAPEIERIFRRNELQFRLCHHWAAALNDRAAVAQLSPEPAATQRELTAPRVMFEMARRRYSAHRLKQRGSDFDLVRDQFRSLPVNSTEQKPRVLLVTPFAIFPPAHGGARRIGEIGRGLTEHAEVLLLSDEASLYGHDSHRYFLPYRSVHLVSGRGDRLGEPPLTLRSRVERHAYARMRAELRRLIAVHKPDIVQLEHMELAALVEERHAGEKWVLTLHDVYLDGGEADAWQNEMLARFDALIVCSEEDAALLSHSRVVLVPNGGVDRLDEYSPSRDGPRVLFMGPFRYEPNRRGILTFLRGGWLKVREEFPDATLTILGGPESAGAQRSEPLLAGPGVTLISQFVDPAPYLADATLTLNPQTEIRGSALKVIESLLAGRCCITTAEGARGFTRAGLNGLVIAGDIPAIADAIVELAHNTGKRHGLELPAAGAIDALTWRGSAARQLDLYRLLMERA